MAHGLPTSSGRASSVLFRPLRLVVPIGWIGGRYTTSNPAAAISSSRVHEAGALLETTLGPGEELVPRAPRRDLAVDPKTMAGRRRELVRVDHAVEQFGDRVVETGAESNRLGTRRTPKRRHRVGQPRPLRLRNRRRQSFDQTGPDLELQTEIVSGGRPEREVASPGGEPVEPRLHLELVVTGLVDRDRALHAAPAGVVQTLRLPPGEPSVRRAGTRGPRRSPPPHPGARGFRVRRATRVAPIATSSPTTALGA